MVSDEEKRKRNRERARDWYYSTKKKDPALLRKKLRESYLRNRAKKLAAGRENYKANIEIRRANARKRYSERREQEIDAARRRRKENPGKVREITRASHHKKKFGLTREMYAEMLKKQDGKCANLKCSALRATESGRKQIDWHVDHDHKTGRIRGLLCQRCNLMIGFAKDMPSVLRGAADYLTTGDTNG